MAEFECKTIVLDANVVINLAHINRLDLLGSFPGLTFVVPKEVVNEITDPLQAQILNTAITEGHLAVTELTDITEIEHYAELSRTLGKGESACLAVAHSRDCSLASDEKRLFRRTATGKIGESRIWTTPDIILHAIKSGLATVEEADQWKRILAENQFVMTFGSFQELL